MLLVGLKGKILDFNQRLEISIDVAHGLTYLHLYAGNYSISTDTICFSNCFWKITEQYNGQSLMILCTNTMLSDICQT